MTTIYFHKRTDHKNLYELASFLTAYPLPLIYTPGSHRKACLSQGCFKILPKHVKLLCVKIFLAKLRRFIILDALANDKLQRSAIFRNDTWNPGISLDLISFP